LAIPE
jgi:hypothetical protein